jgi:hypothetical protein
LKNRAISGKTAALRLKIQIHLTPKNETAARKTVALRLKNKPDKQNLFHRCNSF